MKNDINIDEYKSAVEVLNQIKEKCKASTSASEKIVLLTLAPKTWGRKRLAAEFNVSERQARKAIQLVKEHGILTSPMPKKGRLLSAEVKNLVVNFYSDDENSRMLPGKKDYVSVKKEDGSREHQQKRLILCNLSELYSNFRQQNQGVKIGFSTFSQLRPRNCVLAGSSGTHTVCVCVHHENVHLMLDGSGIGKLTLESNHPIATYHDAIKTIICEKPGPKCFLNECSLCSGTDSLQSHLLSVFENHCIDRVEYQIWHQTDRSTLRNEFVDVEDFVEEFCGRILKLKSHSFIAKEQSHFLKNLKENLQESEFLVLCDFAENYAFIAQNSAQAFHWNNNQATIFTIGIYYQRQNDLKFKGVAIL